MAHTTVGQGTVAVRHAGARSARLWHCAVAWVLVPLSTTGLSRFTYASPLPGEAIGYEATDATPLSGDHTLSAKSIDEYARVVGSSKGSGTWPAVWINGRTWAFTAEPYFDNKGAPYGMSPSTGIVVGWARSGLETAPVAWTRNQVHEPRIPDYASGAYAWDVNDQGWIAGESYFPETAVLWRPGREPLDLGTFSGDPRPARAFSINDRGEVTGQVYTRDFGHRAFVWREDVGMIDISDPNNPRNDSYGYGINDLGEVVGYSIDVDDNEGVFLWRDGDFFYYPKLNGCDNARQYPSAINNLGQVVGKSIGCGAGGGVVWWETEVPGNFAAADLGDSTWIRGVDPGIRIYECRDINDGGQILAMGEDSAFDDLAMVLTPYHFTLSDLTPGIAGEVNELTIANLEPGSDVHLIWGRNEGAQKISAVLGSSGGGGGNPPIDCPGAPILIQQPRGVFGPVAADAAGEVNLRFMIPDNASGQTVRIQAAVPDLCRVSHVVEVTIE